MPRPPLPPADRASERVPCYLRPVEAARLDRRRGEASRSGYLVAGAGLGEPYDLRALTIMQPWAQLVVLGRKLWENRPRALSVRPEGQWVAVHAGKGQHPLAAQAEALAPDLDLSNAPRGAILGLCWLGPAVPLDVVAEHRQWALGPLCHPVSHAMALPEPIPMTGQLGLWRVPREVVDHIEGMVGCLG